MKISLELILVWENFWELVGTNGLLLLYFISHVSIHSDQGSILATTEIPASLNQLYWDTTTNSPKCIPLQTSATSPVIREYLRSNL